jgi:hypothetical protein
MSRTSPTRCACPPCVSRSVARARSRLCAGQPDVAIAILNVILQDLPPGRCVGNSDPRTRIVQLEAQLIEAKGWAMAYRAQEQSRIALGDKCPCPAGARR